jgi:hypothetical protein
METPRSDTAEALGRPARPPVLVWLERNGPLLGLGLILLGAAALLLFLDSRLTFFQDTWEFLMNRRSFSIGSILEPHNEHIVVIPVLIQQLLLVVFGMTSAMPEYVLLTVALLVTAVLLFVYVRRRLGPWPALMAAALLLFVGPAWQDILWPFEIGFVGSVLFGIAMLLALERDDRRGDAWACLFLVVSIGFNSLGIAFAAAAAVEFLQHRRSRGSRRIWVVGLPLLLYAAWYLGWGHDAESHLSLRNVLGAPRFVLESLAASIESLLGLSSSPIVGVGRPEWGQALLVGLVALLLFGQWRKPGFYARLWPAAAAAVTYWLLTALNYIPGREPTTSRYLYASAALFILVGVNLLKDVRFGRRAFLIAATVTVAAVMSNLVQLKDGADWFRNQAVLTKADLGAMEIARGTISPNFALSPEIAGTPSLIDVEAQKYFAAVDEYGSPAYTPDELAAAPVPGPRQADLILASALSLSLVTRSGQYDSSDAGSENCVTLPAGSSAPAPEIQLAPGRTRIEVAPGPRADFSLRRFARGGYPVGTEGAPGESTTMLAIPRDRAPQPWFLQVTASQQTRVCR